MKIFSYISFLLLALITLFLFSACSETEETVYYPTRLRIATYNVEDFAVYNTNTIGGKFVTAYDMIANYITNNKIDVIVMQEMQPGNSKLDTYSDGTISSPGDEYLFNKALSERGYSMPYYAFNNNGGSRNDYIGVWSRYKLYDVTSVRPSRMVDPNTGNWFDGYRPALRFRIKYKSNDIWFYSLHLKSSSGGDPANIERRRAQAHHLERYIKENHKPETDKIVILGDFNTTEPQDFENYGASTMDYLCLKNDNPGNTNNDFVPVNLKHIGRTNYNGWTFVIGVFTNTLDHIVLSPSLYKNHYVPGSVDIMHKNTTTDGGSDHFPILLHLDFAY